MRFFGPKDLFRKQIKAEEKQRGGKTRDHTRKQEASGRKTHSRMVRFFGVLSSLMVCLPLSMAMGFSLLEQGRICEMMVEFASGFPGHLSRLFY
jgi:hypothetical protein